MTSTPNKGYPLQVTATNVGTWGTVANSTFSTIDNNLGGTLALSVAGSSDVLLTASQAQNLIYNLTGALTGNIDVAFPQQGGFYFVNNQTSGAFTLTLKATGCTGSVPVPQGTQVVTYVDATGLVIGVTGTQYNFVAGAVGGTANALTVAQTFPVNFSLNNGTFITFTPSNNNTGSATLNVGGTGAVTIQKLGAVGLINLESGDLFDGVPVIAQYNGSVWIALNVVFAAVPAVQTSDFGLSFAQWFQLQVCTAALTITVTQTTNLTYYFTCSIMAVGGGVVITPNAADVITVGGTVLAAGASYTLPQGSFADFSTDANGNIYLKVSYPFLPGQIPGTSTNDNASAGNVGQFITGSAGGVSLTNSTPANITSISLTAGDWDVWGIFSGAATGNITTWLGSVSSTSGTAGGLGTLGTALLETPASSGTQSVIPTGTARFSLSTTTTIYLVGQCNFSTGTCTGAGTIGARRVR